jgi:hypothetical protein
MIEDYKFASLIPIDGYYLIKTKDLIKNEELYLQVGSSSSIIARDKYKEPTIRLYEIDKGCETFDLRVDKIVKVHRRIRKLSKKKVEEFKKQHPEFFI